MTKNITEGIICTNNQPLTVGSVIWQSLVQLSKGKRFFERYDLRCVGYVREENCQDMLRNNWYIGAVAAMSLMFNNKEVQLSEHYGRRAAVLVNFKEKTLRIVTREPTKAQYSKIQSLGSKMKRIPLVVHDAEALKARIWKDRLTVQ